MSAMAGCCDGADRADVVIAVLSVGLPLGTAVWSATVVVGTRHLVWFVLAGVLVAAAVLV